MSKEQNVKHRRKTYLPKTYETEQEPISDPKVLWNEALEGRAIYASHWSRHSPAAFIVSMPFRIVMRDISLGRFYKIKSK